MVGTFTDNGSLSVGGSSLVGPSSLCVTPDDTTRACTLSSDPLSDLESSDFPSLPAEELAEDKLGSVE